MWVYFGFTLDISQPKLLHAIAVLDVQKDQEQKLNVGHFLDPMGSAELLCRV